jgi:hypothetical protein
MAAIGVKFGQCGSNLNKAAVRITEKTAINLGLIDLYFINILSLECTKIVNHFNKSQVF